MAQLRVIDRREVDSETALGALTNLLKTPSDPQGRFSLTRWVFRALGV